MPDHRGERMNKPTMKMSISGTESHEYNHDTHETEFKSSTYNFDIYVRDATKEQYSEIMTRIGYMFKEICGG